MNSIKLFNFASCSEIEVCLAVLIKLNLYILKRQGAGDSLGVLEFRRMEEH